MKPDGKEEESSEFTVSSSPKLSPPSALRQAMIAGAQVVQMAISVMVSYYLGVWLDQKLGTTSLFSWGGLILGGIGASAILFRLVKQVEDKRM